jgi:hypothetical protein
MCTAVMCRWQLHRGVASITGTCAPCSSHLRSVAFYSQECSSRLLELDFKKGQSPPGLELDGGTQYTGCVACDEALRDLCEVSGQGVYECVTCSWRR